MRLTKVLLKFTRGYKNSPNVNLSEKTPSQLSYFIRRISQAGQVDVKFWTDVNAKILSIYKDLGPRNVSFIANGLARANISDFRVWKLLAEQAIALSHRFDSQDISLFLNAASKMYKCKMLFEMFSKAILQSEMPFKAKHIALIINAYSRVGYRDLDVLNKLFMHVEEVKAELDFQEFANILNGCYKLKYLHKSFVQLLKDELTFRLRNVSKTNCAISGQNIANILQALAHSDIKCNYIVSKFGSILINNHGTLNPIEVTAISNALGKIKYNEPEFLRYITFQVYSNFNNYTLDQHSIILYCLCRLDRVPMDFFVTVMNRISNILIKSNDKTMSMLFTAITVRLANYTERSALLDDLYPLFRARIQKMVSDSNKPTQQIVASVVCSFARVGLEDLLIYDLIDFVDLNDLDNSTLAAIIHGLGKFHSKQSLEYVIKYLQCINTHVDKLLPLHVSNILKSIEKNVENFVAKCDCGIQTIASAVSSLSLNLSSKYREYSEQLLSSALNSYTLICEYLFANSKTFGDISQTLHIETVKDIVLECFCRLHDVNEYEGTLTFVTSIITEVSIGDFLNITSNSNKLNSISCKLLERLAFAHGRYKNLCLKMAIDGSVDELNYKNYLEQLNNLQLNLDGFMVKRNNEAWFNVVENDRKSFSFDKISLPYKILNEYNEFFNDKIALTDVVDKVFNSIEVLEKFNFCVLAKSIANAIDYLTTTNRANFTPFLYRLLHKLSQVILKSIDLNELVSTTTYLCNKNICIPSLIDYALSQSDFGDLKIKFIASLKSVPYKLSNCDTLISDFNLYLSEKLKKPFPPQLDDIFGTLSTLQRCNLLQDSLLNSVVDTVFLWKSWDQKTLLSMQIVTLLHLTSILLFQLNNHKSGSVVINISSEYQKDMFAKLIEWAIELSDETSDKIILDANGYHWIMEIVKNFNFQSPISDLLPILLARIHLPIHMLYDLAELGYLDRIIQSKNGTGAISTFIQVQAQSLEINKLWKSSEWIKLCKLAYVAANYLNCDNHFLRNKAEAIVTTVLDMLARADTRGIGSDIIARLSSHLYTRHDQLIGKLTDRSKLYLNNPN